MKRIDYNSPEWLLIREMLSAEYDAAVKHLVNKGLTEGEYHQWRGRALLATKLLNMSNGHQQVTD